MPQYIKENNWDLNAPSPIEEIAIGIRRRINTNVSPLMLEMLMETIEDGTTGTLAGKYCAYRGKSEYEALVKYFDDMAIRQAPGTDSKTAFDYVTKTSHTEKVC